MPWLNVNQTRLCRFSAVPIPVLALDVQRGRIPGPPGASPTFGSLNRYILSTLASANNADPCYLVAGLYLAGECLGAFVKKVSWRQRSARHGISLVCCEDSPSRAPCCCCSSAPRWRTTQCSP